MQTLTLEQLRAATNAGGVVSATVKAQGGDFLVQIATRNGDALLAKARSTEPRRFGNPAQAITLLRDVGILVGTFDVTQWNPNESTVRARPDRAEALRQVHQAAEYDAWFRSEVEQGLREADDPATEWVSHEVVKEDMRRQREELIARIGAKAK